MTALPEPMDEQRPQVAGAAGGEAEARPPWTKILLLAAVVGALLAVVYLSPLRDYLGRAREISEHVRALGMLAPLVLTISVAALVAIGFPRLVLCVIAGMALGFWSGVLWTQLGTLLGNYAVFLLARRSGRAWAQRYLSRRGKLHSLIRQEGISGVILARQLPVPGLLINLACGLVSIRHRDFLLGTILGQLPEAVPCTLIGAGAIEGSFQKSVWVIGLAVVATIVAWIALRWLLRWQRSRTAVR